MDLLLIFACFYFAYSEIAALIDYGSQPWELVHYLLLLLAIALAAMGIWRSVVYYKEWKYKKTHPEEDETAVDSSAPKEIESTDLPEDTESNPDAEDSTTSQEQ